VLVRLPELPAPTAQADRLIALGVHEIAGLTPLTLTEGSHWVLQHSDVLDRNPCFMAIGSRARKPNSALDTRKPLG